MTREEQIAVAFDDYSDARKLSTFDDFEYTDIQVAFEEGAEWADANPKSQWISVEDDLPCNHQELVRNKYYTKKVLVILAWNGNPAKKHIELCDMCNKVYPCNTNWRWRQPTYYHVTHWMPIQKLPK